MWKMNWKMQGLVLIIPLLLMACEKPYVGEEQDVDVPTQANLTLRVTGFEMIPFSEETTSRAVQNLSEVCSRLNFVVYSGDTKVQSIVQKKGDAGFGTVALTLPQGDYQVAVIGHSSEGSATISSLDKISFKNNIVTDTFLKYLPLTVGEQPQTLDLELKRVVAMFRLSLTQALPDNITQLKFYYTGGSSTLSAITGYGSVNSKQTVVLNVAAGQRNFEVYTIPHAETGELKMTISALDASGTVMKERPFEGVSVQRNMITCYTGDFFNGASTETGESSFQMKVNAEWEGETSVLF